MDYSKACAGEVFGITVSRADTLEGDALHRVNGSRESAGLALIECEVHWPMSMYNKSFRDSA